MGGPVWHIAVWLCVLSPLRVNATAQRMIYAERSSNSPALSQRDSRLRTLSLLRPPSAKDGSSPEGIRGAAFGAVLGAGVGFLFTGLCDNPPYGGCRRRLIIGGAVVGAGFGYLLDRALGGEQRKSGDAARLLNSRELHRPGGNGSEVEHLREGCHNLLAGEGRQALGVELAPLPRH